MSVNSKMTAIADAIRSKTGDTAKLSLDEMAVAIAGIEAGGGGETIGTPDTLVSFTGLLYALTSGNYKSGEFTFATPLPNTETLIFSSGLSKINGMLIVMNDFPTDYNTISSQQRTGLYIHFPSIDISTSTETGITYNKILVYDNGINSVTATGGNNAPITQGYIRIDAGDFYVTAKYNNNIGYTPFAPAKTYTWIAW